MQRPTIEQQVTFLYTADLAATAVFYETILQLPLVLDQGVCRIYATGGDAYIGFCQALSAEAGNGLYTQGIILTLVIGNRLSVIGYRCAAIGRLVTPSPPHPLTCSSCRPHLPSVNFPHAR